MTYALGRRVEYYDQPTIRAIVRQASEDDYSWSSLVMGVVNSPAFTTSGAALQAAERRAERTGPEQLASRAN